MAEFREFAEALLDQISVEIDEEKEIMKLVKRIQSQSMKLGEKFDYEYNKIRHQYTESECGMYCLYFIVKLLEGKTYESLTKNKIPDKPRYANPS